MWNLRQNLESSGHQEKYKSHTSVGRKFAPVEGLSHDLVCTGSIYHVHFTWQVWHGQLSPRFKFNKLKSFSGVEIDQNHVDKRILGGKGFAVGRLKRHNFCPASVFIILQTSMAGRHSLWFWCGISRRLLPSVSQATFLKPTQSNPLSTAPSPDPQRQEPGKSWGLHSVQGVNGWLVVEVGG